MKLTKCDICKEDAYHEVDVCHGFIESTTDSEGTSEYKPFEVIRDHQVRKTDLCEKHYKIWCKATYLAFWKLKK